MKTLSDAVNEYIQMKKEIKLLKRTIRLEKILLNM